MWNKIEDLGEPQLEELPWQKDRQTEPPKRRSKGFVPKSKEQAFEFYKEQFTQKCVLTELKNHKEAFHQMLLHEQEKTGFNIDNCKKQIRTQFKQTQGYRILTDKELRENVRTYIVKWVHLIDQDLFQESVDIAKQICFWSHHRLRSEGLVLTGLSMRREGRNLDKSHRLRFGRDKRLLPDHHFEPGTTVVVSEKDPVGEYLRVLFGEVDYCNQSFIILRVEGEIPENNVVFSGTKTFRIDRGPNFVIVSRLVNAFSKFSGPLSTSCFALRNIICQLTKEFFPRAEDFKYFDGEMKLKNILLETEGNQTDYEKGEIIFKHLRMFKPDVDRNEFISQELGVWKWKLDEMTEKLDLLIPIKLLDSLSDILDKEIDVFEYKDRDNDRWDVDSLLGDYDMAVKEHYLKKLQLLKPDIEFEDYYLKDKIPRWDMEKIKFDLEAAKSVEEQVQREDYVNEDFGEFKWPSTVTDQNWNNSSFCSTRDVKRVNEYLLDSDNLNVSQCQAIVNCITSKVSCIQGPPGTGKTSTAINLINIYVKILKRTPVLASAFSNVACNHLLAGLHELGIKCCRIGQTKKVPDELKETLLEVQRMNHPKMKKLLDLTNEADDVADDMRDVKRHTDRWLQMNTEEKRLRRLVLKLKDEIQKEILSADVIVATCIGVSSYRLRNHEFSLVVVDECTQSTEPSTLLPISKCGGQLVLIGDQCQLPPVIKTSHLRCSDLTVSMFDRLIQQHEKHSKGVSACLLRTQYRMHPLISLWPNLMFYNGRIADGISAVRRKPPRGFPWPEMGPLAFVPVESHEEKDMGPSKFNKAECEVAFDIVNSLLSIHDGEMDPSKIGIVTPYAAQVSYLKRMFSNKRIYSGLEIKSVDGYQGREKEVIVFTTVRANQFGNVGFVADRRRINVALTRARRGLIVVGNYDTLSGDSSWRSWIRFVDYNALIVSPRDLYYSWRVPPPRSVEIPDASFNYYSKPIWRKGNYEGSEEPRSRLKKRKKERDHYRDYWRKRKRSKSADRSRRKDRKGKRSGDRKRSRSRDRKKRKRSLERHRERFLSSSGSSERWTGRKA